MHDVAIYFSSNVKYIVVVFYPFVVTTMKIFWTLIKLSGFSKRVRSILINVGKKTRRVYIHNEISRVQLRVCNFIPFFKVWVITNFENRTRVVEACTLVVHELHSTMLKILPFEPYMCVVSLLDDECKII